MVVTRRAVLAGLAALPVAAALPAAAAALPPPTVRWWEEPKYRGLTIIADFVEGRFKVEDQVFDTFAEFYASVPKPFPDGHLMRGPEGTVLYRVEDANQITAWAYSPKRLPDEQLRALSAGL